MKIEHKLDLDVAKMVRRFITERARRHRVLDKETQALQSQAEKIQKRRQKASDDELDGVNFALRTLGYSPEFAQSLRVNLQDGSVVWDDGEPDPEAEKAKTEKLIGESARALARGKKTTLAEAVAEAAGSKNGE